MSGKTEEQKDRNANQHKVILKLKKTMKNTVISLSFLAWKLSEIAIFFAVENVPFGFQEFTCLEYPWILARI